MGNKWVLSVRTSLPGICRSKDDLKTVFYVYDSFEEARDALHEKAKQFAFSENAMFDGDGHIKKLCDYVEQEFEELPIDEQMEIYSFAEASDMIRKALNGETVKIEGILDLDEDGMIAVKCIGDTIMFEGYGDGPINGFEPYIKTNIFDMSEEKDYYLYIDDMLGQDVSSELYIDLKRAEN